MNGANDYLFVGARLAKHKLNRLDELNDKEQPKPSDKSEERKTQSSSSLSSKRLLVIALTRMTGK